VVREFVRLAVKNGNDIFRIFDALNDIRNMEASIAAVKEFGGHVQGVICYTTSPVHTIERFAEMAVELENRGCDSLCVKDMAGLISPHAAVELVGAIKQRVSIPVDLHSHCTSGMAPISYYAAVEAGVNILDTAFSAFGWGTSQPPTESIVASLQGTPYDTCLDLAKLNEINEYFINLTNKYRMLFTAEATRPNAAVLLHQIPGGMISNLVSQLREQKALDRLQDVYAEIPRVRADLGYPPLVTPTSQVVGTQAVLNVLSGQVIGRCLPHHTHAEFLAFLKLIDRSTPKRFDLHLVVDNSSTHSTPAVKQWLAAHPRFVLHFTPTSSSWLNLVERWFAELSRRRIKRGTFCSVPELIRAIEEHIAHNNAHPKPFEWHASADLILGKVARCKEALGAGH
jgi:transposase